MLNSWIRIQIMCTSRPSCSPGRSTVLGEGLCYPSTYI